MMKNKKIIFILLILLISGTVVYAETVYNSKDVSYSNNKSTVTNVSDALDELYANKVDGGSKISIGDYIKITPSKTSYTVPSASTGYSSDQSINPSELNLWRVISINEDGIDVVSENLSSNDICFNGTEGYKRYVDTLNTIASQYTDNNNVISTRHTGYYSQTAIIGEKWSWEIDFFTLSLDNITTNEAREEYGGGDTQYMVDKNLIMKALKTSDISCKKVNSQSSEDTYWLASRAYQYEGRHSSRQFGGHTVGSVTFKQFFTCSISSCIDSISQQCAAVRPILTLKPDIQIKSGNGKTASTAYELQ